MLKIALAAGVGGAMGLMPSAHQESVVYQVSDTQFHYNSGGQLTEARDETPEVIAREMIKQTLGAGNWTLRSSYPTKHNGVTHMAFRQDIDGMECSNCDVTVNVDQHGRVLTFGHNGVPAKSIHEMRAQQKNPIDAVKAIQLFVEYANIMEPEELVKAEFAHNKLEGFAHHFNFPALAEKGKTTGDVTATLKYYYDHDRAEMALAWLIEMETELPHYAHYEAWMHSESGKPIAVQDLVAWDGADTHLETQGSTYEAFLIPDIDPRLGERIVTVDPAEEVASPMGWHSQGNGVDSTKTQGNNVYAQENWNGNSGWQNNYRPDGGAALDFQFPVDFNAEPRTYADASIANLCYWNNLIHDLFHIRGFDEPAGNFQENNLGRGGAGSDAVQANAQDGAGYNNANMMTPRDGQRGRMRMYLWNRVRPMIDGDFDTGIVIHEYAHGITNRLTGGPANVGCLRGAQSGGMGEGWGDFWATTLAQRPEFTREMLFPMGVYAAGRSIRPFPYTGTAVSVGVNPQTFGFINQAGYTNVHAIGSVWCQILFSVFWEMKDAHGFDKDWYYGTGGNNKFHLNVVDGTKLQPCNPNFVQARDAIIAADRVNFGGVHKCTMWRGFAGRGLGVGAKSNGNSGPVVEDFTMPAECE